MAQVIYSGEALADFERIIEFLLETSVDSATQALVSIRSAVGILEAHPLIGRRVDGHIRELVISERATGYLALYRFDAAFNVVRILRIRRGNSHCAQALGDTGTGSQHYALVREDRPRAAEQRSR
jgi:plasmid stabilization system protein ParE